MAVSARSPRRFGTNPLAPISPKPTMRAAGDAVRRPVRWRRKRRPSRAVDLDSPANRSSKTNGTSATRRGRPRTASSSRIL